jgi:hypothetical protein
MWTAPRQQLDAAIAIASILGAVGLIWLAPLMFDQLVFFGDQDQTRQAAASREAMLPASALLLVAAAVLTVRQHPWHALVVALPALVAVPLALLAPGAAYQLLAYGITAPMSLGALLSATVPLPRGLPMAIQLAGFGMLALMGIASSPFIAIMALVAIVIWWRLPQPQHVAMRQRR